MLKGILSEQLPGSSEYANVGQYQCNAEKVEKYLRMLGKKSEENDELLKYLVPRLKEEDAYAKKNLEKVGGLFEEPLEVISFLDAWRIEK